MVAKRPNSKRNLDMALRRIGGADEDYVRRRTKPPTIVKGEEWDRLYADQLLPEPVLQTADEAVAWANELVKRIAEA